MKHWLMKSEPGAYSWDDLIKDKQSMWEGVRNYQARNNMKLMKKGDLVLFYHSVNQKQVVGVAKVVKTFYQDPTTDDDRWVVVDIVPVNSLKRPVTLKEIKAKPELSEIALVKQARLSVMPLTQYEFDTILSMSEENE